MVARFFAVGYGPLNDLERLKSGESEAVDMRVIYQSSSVDVLTS